MKGSSKLLKIGASIFVVMVVIISCASPGPKDPNQFGIFISHLDGTDVRRILSDPSREINHARVSPDKQWITFTRYNKKNFSGLAKEENGYEDSEIMLARIDGSNLQTLVPTRKGMIAANGYWTEDGKSILYVSNDNKVRQGQINRIDIATRSISKVNIPGDPWAADPHQIGKYLAISSFDPVLKKNSILISEQGNNRVRVVTSPAKAGIDPDMKLPLGDYDPKISPDASKVVTMRNLGKHNWHSIVIDLNTGIESDISPEVSVDGVPEWSSDSKLLIFWHVDTANLKKSGLYTKDTRGANRTRIPLPGKMFYTMPAFFPGEGSGPKARIIFSGQKNPDL
jgi:Tol biopolymer transport system component